MIRASAVSVAIVLLAVSSAPAWVTVYFEDHFNGPELDPAWEALGTGSYSFVDGELEFMTRQGDYHVRFEGSFGPPRHVFCISPSPTLTQWMAIARVRYNTPDESYEQVDVIVYKDNDNYVKCHYESGSGHRYFGAWLETSSGYGAQGGYNGGTQTGFFWLRIDREENQYTFYCSLEETADPNELHDWKYMATCPAPLGDAPKVGIAGWNTFSTPDGELAEFDYFRLSSIPAFTLDVYTGGLGTVMKDPNLPSYREGTRVTLTALEDYGYDFKFYKIYDPNYPGDRNYAVRDLNNPIELLMIADYEVDAVYGCSTSNVGAMLLVLTVLGIAVMKLAGGRRQGSWFA